MAQGPTARGEEQGKGPMGREPSPPSEESTIVFGRRPVAELLRSGRPVERIWVAEGARDLGPILELASRQALPVQRVPREVLQRLCGTDRHQGVAARASAVELVPLVELLEPQGAVPPQEAAAAAGLPPLLLVLDHLTDPQNVGALLRTAEAVGVRGVVIPARRAAPLTPAVERASAGAVRHVRISRVSSVADALLRIKKAGFWVVGTDPAAERSLWEADLRGAVAVVVGSEGQGMSALVRRRCDLLVRIPMFGRVGSLNASAAGAVVLYEVRRQQQATR